MWQVAKATWPTPLTENPEAMNIQIFKSLIKVHWKCLWDTDSVIQDLAVVSICEHLFQASQSKWYPYVSPVSWNTPGNMKCLISAWRWHIKALFVLQTQPFFTSIVSMTPARHQHSTNLIKNFNKCRIKGSLTNLVQTFMCSPGCLLNKQLIPTSNIFCDIMPNITFFVFFFFVSVIQVARDTKEISETFVHSMEATYLNHHFFILH